MTGDYNPETPEGHALSMILFALGAKGREALRSHFFDLAGKGNDDARRCLNVLNSREGV